LRFVAVESTFVAVKPVLLQAQCGVDLRTEECSLRAAQRLNLAASSATL
jgi:hypothetical protein